MKRSYEQAQSLLMSPPAKKARATATSVGLERSPAASTLSKASALLVPKADDISGTSGNSQATAAPTTASRVDRAEASADAEADALAGVSPLAAMALGQTAAILAAKTAATSPGKAGQQVAKATGAATAQKGTVASATAKAKPPRKVLTGPALDKALGVADACLKECYRLKGAMLAASSQAMLIAQDKGCKDCLVACKNKDDALIDAGRQEDATVLGQHIAFLMAGKECAFK